MNTSEITALHSQLCKVDRDLGNAERIDQITALERAKSAICAAQAVLTSDLDTAIRRQRAADGIAPSRRSRGIASQIGLARQDSPHRGVSHLRRARVLADDMPHTLKLLYDGTLNEWRVNLLVKEVMCLGHDDRRAIDAELCSDPKTLAGVCDEQLTAHAYRLAAERDPGAVVERARRAPKERSVSTKPAPDTMAHVTSLLPMKQAVSIHATLKRDADQLLSSGDDEGRTRNQVMADLLTERVLGISSTDQIPVAVEMVLSDESLLGGGNTPAHVQGYGPIPAAIARGLVLESLSAETRTSLRRLYTQPDTGALTGMESAARLFPKSLAHLIDVRDQRCRTPWCGAPIRHHDHIVDHQRGGPTSEANGAGLCQACNHSKQGQGWVAETTSKPGQLHSFRLTTPTGHEYRSTAPPMPTPARKAS